jgi:hypothetical protein
VTLIADVAEAKDIENVFRIQNLIGKCVNGRVFFFQEGVGLNLEMVRLVGPSYCITNPGKTLTALLNGSFCHEVAENVQLDSHFFEQSGTCLQVACINGQTDVVLLLLRMGANLNYLNDAPFRAAAFGGHTQLVTLLLEKGADIHSEHDNALISAAQEGHIETVRALLDRGAYLHIFDNLAVRIAKRNGHMDVVDLLESVIQQDLISL